MSWLELFGGGLLLYFGAEWFVSGAARLALLMRVPQLIVGLTVVAYGTSAPEVIVGVQAALTAHGDVALGNVVGSNVANIGLILGISVLFRPARVDAALARWELPVLLASTAAVPLTLLDGKVSAIEAWALIAGAVIYTALMVYRARQARAVSDATAATTAVVAAASEAGAPTSAGPLRAVAVVSVGLVALIVGGRLFVDGAVTIALALGMSDRIVGLTIVAVGTSLPELVTSLAAARRGNSDIAVGNVVGSNIFNVLLCLGAAAIAGPVSASLMDVRFDLAALGVMTVMAVVFIRSARTVSRGEGALLLVAYAAFICVLIWRS